MDYIFGTGIGDLHQWSTEADLRMDETDGPADIIILDFDGDGFLDDALWDSSGDGEADRAILNFDTDDARFFSDPEHLGVWATEVSAMPADDTGGGTVTPLAPPVLGWSDGGAASGVPGFEIAVQGHGSEIVRVEDTNRDGSLDSVSIGSGTGTVLFGSVGLTGSSWGMP